MMNRIFAFCFSVLALFACHQAQRESSPAAVSDTVSFTTGDVESAFFDVVGLRAAGIVSKQCIHLQVIVKNTGNLPVDIHPAAAELHCRNGTRSTAVRHSAEIILNENDSTAIDLEFEPLQSRLLFQYTGLRGDLDRNYKVLIPFKRGISASTLEIILESDSLIIHKAIERFGIAGNVHVFTIEHVTQSGKEDRNSEMHAVNTGIQHERLRITDNEILSQGLWTKFSIFSTADTLFLGLRMLNQTGRDVIINTERLKIQMPSNAVTSTNGSLPGILKLKNSDRAALTLKFHVPIQEHYELDATGISFDDDKSPVIGSSIIFEPLNNIDGRQPL